MPRVARELTLAEAAYIAGLIDGEGTVTLVRRHRNETRHLAVTIASTERNMLEFVLCAARVGKITNKKSYQRHHRPSFAYAVYNRQALQLLSQIQPHLISYKARRSALALERYVEVTPRNGKYTPQLRQARELFVAEFLGIKP